LVADKGIPTEDNHQARIGESSGARPRKNSREHKKRASRMTSPKGKKVGGGCKKPPFFGGRLRKKVLGKSLDLSLNSEGRGMEKKRPLDRLQKGRKFSVMGRKGQSKKAKRGTNDQWEKHEE